MMLLLARYCQQVFNGKVIVWVWVSASASAAMSASILKDNTLLISID
jgi:hypothetical protein